jgi:hypothetical protein
MINLFEKGLPIFCGGGFSRWFYRWGFEIQMFAGGMGSGAALPGAGDKTDLEEVGFDHVFESIAFLTESGGEGFDAGGAAVIGGDQGFKESAVEAVQAQVINFFNL